MEDRIEIGEYIRTKSGRIAKCTGIEHRDIPIYYFDNIVFSAGFHNDYNDLQENELSQIKKHSKDIIDLIEVGDIVKCKDLVLAVDDIYKTKHLVSDKSGKMNVFSWNIESILTHENYENCCYEVGEKNG